MNSVGHIESTYGVGDNALIIQIAEFSGQTHITTTLHIKYSAV